MATGGIPTGGFKELMGLLGRIKSPESGAADAKAPGQAETQAQDKAPVKGEAFGPGLGLLFGQGYALKDQSQAGKNAQELSDLKDFLLASAKGDGSEEATQNPMRSLLGDKLPKGGGLAKSDQAKDPAKNAESRDAKAQGDEADAKSDARSEAKSETKADPRNDARADARLAWNKEEARAPVSDPEAQDRGQDDSGKGQGGSGGQEHGEDEGEKAGLGWVPEEFRETDPEARNGLRSASDFDFDNRCQGRLEDGERCLHRALDGHAFCRAHMGFVEAAALRYDAPAEPDPSSDPASKSPSKRETS